MIVKESFAFYNLIFALSIWAPFPALPLVNKLRFGLEFVTLRLLPIYWPRSTSPSPFSETRL